MFSNRAYALSCRPAGGSQYFESVEILLVVDVEVIGASSARSLGFAPVKSGLLSRLRLISSYTLRNVS